MDRSKISPKKSAARSAAGKKAAETRRRNALASVAAVASDVAEVAAVASDAHAVASDAQAVASIAAAASNQAVQQSHIAMQLGKQALQHASEMSDEESSSESEDSFSTPTTHGSPVLGRRRGCPTHILVMFGLIGMVVGAVICILSIFRNQYSKVKRDAMGQPVLDRNGQEVREVNLMNVILTIVISILFGAVFALVACMLYERYRS